LRRFMYRTAAATAAEPIAPATAALPTGNFLLMAGSMGCVLSRGKSQARNSPNALHSFSFWASGIAACAGLDDGSAINLVVIDNRVRFEVSLGATEKSGLKLSSRMLSVALWVRPAG